MPEELVWHRSPFPSPDENRVRESLPTALARILASCADRPAILHGGRCFTFHDLGCRAAGLADEIRQTNPGGGPVALLQSMGFDAVAAWFACALAGRSFVVLEPDHPPQRLQELIGAAGCSLILSDAATVHHLPDRLSVPMLISVGRIGSMSLDRVLGVDQASMFFPTSGSSGTPKVIAYSASTLQVKIQASMQLMRVPAGARVHIAGSHANYGFLHHALVFLFAGGTLCLADVKKGGFAAVSSAILELGARHVRFTPSMFRTFARSPEAQPALPCLEAVRFSGEPLLRSDLELAQSILKSDCLIQNIYGSTESALFVWSRGDEIDDGATVPIGHIYPLWSYALQRQTGDDQDDPRSGQLMIRSAFHALGDLQEGAVDPSRFRSTRSGAKETIYETGDRVRQLPGGGLVHLGRMDRMVKIRGQRVFLTEIENHLRAMPGVTGAAVVERSQHPTTELYGFITTGSPDLSQEDARAWLSSRLPDFMTPRDILIVREIPLTPGGKVDSMALLDAARSLSRNGDPSGLGDDDYSRLAQAWDSVLWPGAHQQTGDFSSLGGDSLKIMELMVEIESRLGRTFVVTEFVKDATLWNLGRLLQIDVPQNRSVRPDGLLLRQILPARQPSRGIALAAPGWSGHGHAVPFNEAGIFIDHDLWSADFGIRGDSILEDGQWWRAAVRIAGKIRAGDIPAPRVIFGYSAGGSIAWIVGRLLAGTPQCPQYVVMVDASPLHRLPAYRRIEAEVGLTQVSGHAPPPALHLRRATFPEFGIGMGNTQKWEHEDHVVVSIDMPTTEHLEMGRSEVLALGASAVAGFMNGEAPPVNRSIAPVDLGLYGSRFHKFLRHPENAERTELEAIIREMPARIEFGSFLGLFRVAVQRGRDMEAKAIIEAGLMRHPNSSGMHYLKYRLRRSPEILCRHDTPRRFPTRLRELEASLAQRPTKIHRSAPRIVRQFVQMVDVARAILAAKAVNHQKARKEEHRIPSSMS